MQSISEITACSPLLEIERAVAELDVLTMQRSASNRSRIVEDWKCRVLAVSLANQIMPPMPAFATDASVIAG